MFCFLNTAQPLEYLDYFFFFVSRKLITRGKYTTAQYEEPFLSSGGLPMTMVYISSCNFATIRMRYQNQISSD